MKKKLIALTAAGFLIFAFTGLCLAEPEFSVTGWFRARSYWVPNIALDKTSTRENTYSDQRLILDPVLKITDAIQIKMRIRALDYIWGHTTMFKGLTFDRQIDKTGARPWTDPNSHFTWDRAWAVISLGKYGTLQIGRMDCSLFHNYFVSEEDTYPRYNYIAPAITVPETIGGGGVFLCGILYDKRVEGDVDKTYGAPGFAGFELDIRGGEMNAFTPWFFLGTKKFQVGYTWFPFIAYFSEGQGGTQIVHFHDAMFDAKLGPVNLMSEGTHMAGKLDPNLRMDNAWAYFVDLSVPVEEETVPISKVAVQVGHAGGCRDPAKYPEAAFPVGDPWGLYGYTLNKMALLGLNVEWDVDLILWDQIYESVRNATYIRGRVDFKTPAEKISGYIAGIYSIADQYARFQPPVGTAATTLGDEKGMGFEIDLGISYALAEKSSILLGVGYFMPGKYFAEPRDGTLGATVRTNIKF